MGFAYFQYQADLQNLRPGAEYRCRVKLDEVPLSLPEDAQVIVRTPAAGPTSFLAFEFDAARAMVRLANADLEGAYEAAMMGALSSGAPPTLCEWLCPLAARALADLARNALESGHPLAPVISRVDDLGARFPHVIADLGSVPSDVYQHQLDALDALYAAEMARARHADDEADRWRRAVELSPTQFDALLNLGLALVDRSPSEAVLFLQRFVREAPPARYRMEIQKAKALLRELPS